MKKMMLVALAGSFAVAAAAACSSSSTPATTGSGDDAGSTSSGGSSSGTSSGTSSGSSSGSGGEGGLSITCMSATDCSSMGTGYICCGTYTPPTTFGTLCQMADCTPILGSNAQACATDAECRGGATCQANPLLAALMPGAKTCASPSEAGAPSDTGTGSETSTTVDAGGDAADAQ